MTIRFAGLQDVPAVLEIYAQYIPTSVTFEYVLPTREEFARRVEAIGRDWPYLVCEEGGGVLGYAYAHPVWERAAYQWNAELSIYLAPSARGRGLGKKLYALLEEIVRLQGAKALYGIVTIPNPPSEALHRACGFTLAHLFPAVGYKAGDWHDVAWFRKELAPAGPDPEPVRSLRDLPPEEVAAILARYNASR